MALAPKKSIAIQVRLWSSADIAPILGGSGAGVTTSSVGQALPMVAPVPSVGQADAGARRMPSEVAEELAREVMPLLTMGRSELPTTLVVPTLAGAT